MVIAAYAPPMVDALLGPLLPFLHPGDEIDLVSGNHDRPLSVPTLNGWATRLASSLPPGVRFAAHTSGLDKVAEIAQSASPRIASILLDYEPNWDPAFIWEFDRTLVHLDQFASLCRAHGRRAVAYPTGRPLAEAALQRYAWDYGEMRRHVDAVYPQTQHWSTVGTPGWTGAIGRLRSQWSAHGFDPATLVLQLTIGDKDNGLLSATALDRYRQASALGMGTFYLWWTPALLDEVRSLLTAVERDPGSSSPM